MKPCPRCCYPGPDKRAINGGKKRWEGVSKEKIKAAMRAVRKGGKA